MFWTATIYPWNIFPSCFRLAPFLCLQAPCSYIEPDLCIYSEVPYSSKIEYSQINTHKIQLPNFREISYVRK